MLWKEHSDEQLIAAVKQYEGGDIWTIPPPLLGGPTARASKLFIVSQHDPPAQKPQEHNALFSGKHRHWRKRNMKWMRIVSSIRIRGLLPCEQDATIRRAFGYGV